jgi:O-antigen biosynthesis protein
MQSELEAGLGYQPDIYQRYAFLAKLIEAVFGTTTGGTRLRLLDVGSGPARLTEAFVTDQVDVVRADVQSFGDPHIIEINSDGSLPFSDVAFDIVLAMDVLEHVPPDRRPGLIAECQRVAGRAVIIAGPVARPGVLTAEKGFAEFARNVSGRDLEFLAEHVQFGLPNDHDILETFDSRTWQVAAIDNSPLAEWQLFNAVDLIYASDVGDGEAKRAINTFINGRSVFRRANVPHYRTFFCGFRRDDDAEAIRRWTETAIGVAVPLTALELAATSTELLARVRRDLRESGAMAIDVKDKHIEKLDALLRTAVGEKDAQISNLTGTLHEVDEKLAVVTTERDALSTKAETLARALQETSDRAQQEVAAHTSVIDEFSRQLDAVRTEITAIRSSRTWRLMGPVRQLGTMRRRLTQRLHRGRDGRHGDLVPPEIPEDRSSGSGQVMTPLRALVAAPRRVFRQLHQVREIAAQRHLIDALKRELRGARTEIAALSSSGSWKPIVMVPVRRLATLRRRAAMRLRQAPPPPGAAPVEGVLPTGSGVAVDHHRYVPPYGLLPWFNPLTLAVSETLSSSPRLNVLVPGLAMKHMSGGPNTAIALACGLAQRGVAVRFLSTDAAVDPDPGPFWDHLKTLTRVDRLPPHMELVDAHDRSRITYIGANDLFMATAWWTAQQAKYATRLTRQQTFLYLIQDYEPLLHAASTQYALASETYELPHLPVINTTLLHDFLTSQKIGRFRDETFARAALVFEPALDQAIFHPHDTPQAESRRRLLFYARPTNGLRNLFELGVAALQKAIDDGVLDGASWEFLGMGEPFAPVALGKGAALRPVEWVNLEAYARQMRESDLLLSLMLSPHPSYPPLEMAASGGICVTTTFATKTAERLSQLSPNIIGVAPTIESIVEGLDAAIRRLPHRSERLQHAHLPLPQTWSDSFAQILAQLIDEIAILQGSPLLPVHARAATGTNSTSRIFPGFHAWPANEYDLYRRRNILDRREAYPAADPASISFITPVWNTDPFYLEGLAATVLGQDSGTEFEWVILDNGTSRADTREYLARLAQHPSVQLIRLDQNIGIIAGTRLCLERARNQYVVPLDHDDLITPDAVRVLSHYLTRFGRPALAYSDEDKLEGDTSRDPYFKPDWDPVLFVNSCYTAHVCAIDRRLALELGAYTDQETEGSPDWDTFTRFYVAGYQPAHVPELLYTWRMHADSTAGNIHSKPYVFSSHRRVLGRVLAAAADPELYELEPSPLFNGTPDWWIRRAHRCPWPLTTILVTPNEAEVASIRVRTDLSHQIVQVDPSQGLRPVQEIAARCAETGGLVHLLWSGTSIEQSEWPWEAMAHFELFPDTVMIGGRIHDGRNILMAGCYFGFGTGCDSPDRGRPLEDPGYFAQMWKQHSVSAVSIQHCVVRAEFLRDALGPLAGSNIPLAALGPWLGAAAREAGRRIVYSPFFCASTSRLAEDAVNDVTRAAFRSAYRRLLPDAKYLAPALGLSPATAYRPVGYERRMAELDAASPPLSYAEWSSAEAVARSVCYAADTDGPTVSILTTLYSGTDAHLFRETARSLFEQTYPFAEWVILIHGPITPEVEHAVGDCTTDARVRLLRRTDNVGIVNGLKLCLEHASGEFVVPMDADDLLVPDALQVLASEIRSKQPDLIYSDEDTLRDNTIQSPFFRPDFDPVLNAENSYVWHLCAYRRDQALRLGVYQDVGAEFCHDWDTICRFARQGGKVTHARHVLYHWRAHAASHSNSGGQHPGSLASTKAVLTRTIGEQSNPALYQVVPFPIFRGAQEWCIQRLPLNPPPVAGMVLGDGSPWGRAPLVLQRCGFPFRTFHDQHWEEWPALLRRAVETTCEYVVVATADCADIDSAGIWDAVKLFEMHPDVAVVSGRLVNTADVVVECGSVPDSFSRLVSPFNGLAKTDPGPFAMALKSHCILSPAEGLFVARAAFLKRALEHLPLALELSALPAWLAACAVAERANVAYTPLLQARVCIQRRRRGDGSGQEFWRFLENLGFSRSDVPQVIGTAGFLNARRVLKDGTRQDTHTA